MPYGAITQLFNNTFTKNNITNCIISVNQGEVKNAQKPHENLIAHLKNKSIESLALTMISFRQGNE